MSLPNLRNKSIFFKKKLQYQVEEMTKNGIPAIVSLTFNMIL